MFYIVSMELISKSIHHPINKKLRLNSKLLQSGYEPHAAYSILNWMKANERRFSPQTKIPTNVGFILISSNISISCFYHRILK